MKERAMLAIERAELAMEIADIAKERSSLAEVERDFVAAANLEASQKAAKYVRRAEGVRGKVFNHMTQRWEYLVPAYPGEECDESSSASSWAILQ